jgi:hypothetical protein
MSQQIINNGETGLIVRDKLNDMFTEIYGALVTPLKVNGVSANAQQIIPANSYIGDVYISATDLDPVIRIGTAPNGQDIVAEMNPGTFSMVTLQRYFENTTTLYITISGGTVNIRFGILYNFY